MQSIWLNKISQLINYSQIPKNEILGAFVYGSQNYGLATDESDVDIIILTKEITSQKKRTPEGEEIKIFNLSQFASHLQNGDLRCYEILYTKYSLINPNFKSLWEDFIYNFSKVMNYSRIKNSLIKKISEHYNSLLWIPDGKKGDYYCRKRLYWLLRVREQYENIKQGMSFQNSLIHQNILYSDLDKIKTIDKFVSPDDICKIRADFRYFFKETRLEQTEWSNEEDNVVSRLIEGGKNLDVYFEI